MPMIPQFQGGVPQVQDSGNAGVSPARLPAQTFDYAKVMETAMKPVHEFANSFTKTMEVERARMVKAESDDAERQVMGALNDAMMGENGYLNQQGKNAVDGYQKALEGVKSNVDSIMAGLSPQAREAIQSRVYDRVQSTVNQANQHRMVQNRQWQVGSTESRIEALMDDIALHGNDAEYVEKSMASLMQEADYYCNLRGFDEAQTMEYKGKVQDLAVSKQLLIMTDKDPVGAIVLLNSAKDSLSPDIAHKLDNQIFPKAKNLLALSIASKVESGQTAEWTKNPLAQTGDEFIDSLPDDKRVQIAMTATRFVKETETANKASMKADIANSLARAEAGIEDEPLTQDIFEAKLGKDEGAKQYIEYQANLQVAQFKSGVMNLSDKDIEKQLSLMRPKEDDPNYALRMKHYKNAKKAVEEIKQARQKDPIEYLIGTAFGQGVKTINDWNTDNAFKSVAQRLDAGRIASKMYGTQPAILTNDELSAMTKHYDNLGPTERIFFLNNLYKSLQEQVPVVGDNGEVVYEQGEANYGIGALVGQMIDTKSNSQLKTALMLMTDRDVEIGRKFILGEQRVTDKDPEVAKLTASNLAEFNLQINGDIQTDGVFDNEEDKRIAQRAFNGVQAYNGYTAVQNTIEETFGAIEVWNGKKIFMPRRENTGKTYRMNSWFAKDFEDMVSDTTAKLAKEKGTIAFEGLNYTKEAFAGLVKNRQLQTAGNGRYYVKSKFDGSYAKNPDGTYFVLDVLQ